MIELSEEKEEPKSNEDLHKRAMEDYALAEEAWAENRRLALEDIQFRAGAHWPEKIKKQREDDDLPCLVVDKLQQYVRQVVNDARQNTPAVKIRPIDDAGDIKTAEAFQGIIRHIVERSNGDLAIDSATEDAVVGGYGYYRVTTEYAHEKTFNQEICIEKIGNPLSVLLGLPGENPLKANFGFIIDEMTKKQFKAKYPKAKYSDFDGNSDKYSSKWCSDDTVRFAEYFYREEVPTEMHLLADGTVCSAEEYEEAVEMGAPVPAIEETRTLPQYMVKWCRISGAEVLEENEWLGKYIPIIRVVGNEYNIEGEVIYSGLIRAAKDPQRLYNYMRSAFAQRVALTPKSPWLIEEGQIEGREDEWAQANKGTIAVLTYKGSSLDNGHPVPPPQRIGASDIPEGFARDMTLSEHDIQASMGMYAASVGQQGNERSGKAIMARQREGDTATFHYQDNASRAVRDLGFILVDLIPKIIDSKRMLRILGEDGTTTDAINDPTQKEGYRQVGSMAIYNLGVGTYDVSVQSGPSYGTKRAEAAEAMMEIVHNNPEAWNTHGDLIAKAQDWPGAQEWADRSKMLLPPQIQQAIDKNSQQSPEVAAIKAQAEMAIQQRDQQIQEMGQAMQDAQQSVMKLELQVKSNAERAQVDMLKIEVERFKAETDRMQAEASMSQTPQDTSAFDQLKLQYEDKWKQLDADVKMAVAEMQSKTTLKTASMSANAGGDGSTIVDEDGEQQGSPALTALINAVNQNMLSIVQGNQAIAEGLHHVATASKLPRVGSRDKMGNLVSKVLEG